LNNSESTGDRILFLNKKARFAFPSSPRYLKKLKAFRLFL